MWEEQRSLYLLHTLDWDRELDDWLRCFFSGRMMIIITTMMITAATMIMEEEKMMKEMEEKAKGLVKTKKMK
jgi:hypothetical protein